MRMLMRSTTHTYTHTPRQQSLPFNTPKFRHVTIEPIAPKSVAGKPEVDDLGSFGKCHLHLVNRLRFLLNLSIITTSKLLRGSAHFWHVGAPILNGNDRHPSNAERYHCISCFEGGCDRSLANPAARPCTRVTTMRRNGRRSVNDVTAWRARGEQLIAERTRPTRERIERTLLACSVPTTRHLRRLSFSFPES